MIEIFDFKTMRHSTCQGQSRKQKRKARPLENPQMYISPVTCINQLKPDFNPHIYVFCDAPLTFVMPSPMIHKLPTRVDQSVRQRRRGTELGLVLRVEDLVAGRGRVKVRCVSAGHVHRPGNIPLRLLNKRERVARIYELISYVGLFGRKIGIL